MGVKFMRPISLKNSFLAFTLTAFASMTGGFLTACSNASQNQSQAPNATAADVGDTHMQHGSSMKHGSGDLGPADANYDLRFIDAMTPHHQGAVLMALEAQQKSQRPQIKKLANDIIKAQNQEINQLQQWRKAWYAKASSTPMAYNAQMGHMMAMSEEQMKGMMMNSDLGAANAEFDLRFINAMIPHHEGAVTMAQDALNKSKRPEIKQLSQNIVTSQQAEIDQMKQWRQSWYKK